MVIKKYKFLYDLTTYLMEGNFYYLFFDAECAKYVSTSGGINMIEEIIKQYQKYMIREKLTQQEGADKIHISRTHLSRILHGERAPSMALLMRMESVIKTGESSKK